MHNAKEQLQPKPLLRRAALMLPLLALFGLGSASAAVEPKWIKADFAGDDRDELIFTSNLSDVVFNQQGEIIGWYPKVQPGSNLITQRDGEYNFTKLKNSVNLVRGDEAKALEVVLPDNDAEPVVEEGFPKLAVTENGLSAIFRYQQGDAIVTKNVTLNPRQFKVDADINVEGVENYIVNFDGLAKVKNPAVKAVERGEEDVETDGRVEDIQYAALQEPISNGFLGLGSNSYTATALIVKPEGDTRADVILEDGSDAQLALQVSGEANLSVYGGRNELIHLYQEGFFDLPGLFEPNIWGWLSLYVAKLMEWLYSFLNSWFLVIVAITLLIRLAIWPLMQSQARYTARLQYMQPEVQKINEQYKDDPQKRAEATMALYKEHQVNPVGCLPMFIQFPFLIVLWGTIRNFEFDQGFLWLPDLSIPDPYFILAVLYVAANLLSLYVMTRKTPAMFKQQAFIYLIFAYFALTFPAGVTLYWILGTLFTVGQQMLINRQMEAAMAARNVQRVDTAKRADSSKVVEGKVTGKSQGKGASSTRVLPANKRQKE